MYVLFSDWSILHSLILTTLGWCWRKIKLKVPRKLKLIKKLFQDIFNNKTGNKRKLRETFISLELLF